jgi:cytochrome c
MKNVLLSIAPITFSLSKLFIAGALSLMLTPVVAEESMRDLAQQKACLGCHQVDKKRVGPGFKQISARYAGQLEATPHLVAVILEGGRGNWGAIPMPAQTRVTPEQAQQLAQWILTLTPPK